MIEIDRVSHRLGGRPVLTDVSLLIPRGGVTALIGPNGAGKSTLLSLMARLRRLEAGRIRFDGLDVSRTPTRALALVLAATAVCVSVSYKTSIRWVRPAGLYGILSSLPSSALHSSPTLLALPLPPGGRVPPSGSSAHRPQGPRLTQQQQQQYDLL